MRNQPAVTKELIKTTTELRWRNAEVLMTGGSVLSKTADGLLAAHQWLEEHPSVKALLNNTSRIVGAAMWLKNLTPVGLLVGVVMEVGYTQIMKFIEEKTNAQENLSTFLLSIDDDLNKEQADVLASAAIKFMEGAGRMAMHGFASKKVKQWEKGTKGLERTKVDVPKTEPTLKPLGLGSTGRTEPKNLIEQMAMKSILGNPKLGQPVSKMDPLTDPRWLGWTKMRYKVETETGMKVIIHYVAKWENGVLKAVDDFKFK